MQHAGLVRCSVTVAALALVVLSALASDRREKHPRAEVKPDMALIYVARPNTGVHFYLKVYFFANCQFLGLNHGNGYFWAYLPPGKYLFWSLSENLTLYPAIDDVLQLEVEAGKTYYIRQKRKSVYGWHKEGSTIKLVDPAEGDALIDDCQKHSEITDEQRRIGEGYVGWRSDCR